MTAAPERRATLAPEGGRRLQAYFQRRGFPEVEPAPLVQDAGARMYFRLELDPPVVACLMAAPYADGSLPFANSTRLYRSLGVAVPAILDEAPDLGVVLLEDLGDDLLQHRVLRAEPDTAARYAEAVQLLDRIQHGGAAIGEGSEAGTFLAYRMRLDAELFLRELRLFGEHFLAERFGAAESDRWDPLFIELAEAAATTPTALCHRDYHARNLMVPPGGGALRVIDHQDTRLGPRAYDLMSLARDPYVGTRAPFDEAAAAGAIPEPERDTVALQRQLKALGTYGYQVRVRNNPVYARYLEPTLASVVENLARARPGSRRRQFGKLLAGG